MKTKSTFDRMKTWQCGCLDNGGLLAADGIKAKKFLKRSDDLLELLNDLIDWAEDEREECEKLVGTLQPQDPQCVRSYTLKDVCDKARELMSVRLSD
jgi:hypothetical protein